MNDAESRLDRKSKVSAISPHPGDCWEKSLGLQHSVRLHSTHVPYPHLFYTLPSFPRRPLPGPCLSSSYREHKEWGWVPEFQSTSVWELKVKAFASWMHRTLRLTNNECTQSPMLGVWHNVPFVPELISTTSSQPEATQALSEL